jgi:hypothetical protein
VGFCGGRLPRQDPRGAQRPSRQCGESVATSEPAHTPNRHGRRLDPINKKFGLKSSTLTYRRNGRTDIKRQKFVRLLDLALPAQAYRKTRLPATVLDREFCKIAKRRWEVSRQKAKVAQSGDNVFLMGETIRSGMRIIRGNLAVMVPAGYRFAEEGSAVGSRCAP